MSFIASSPIEVKGSNVVANPLMAALAVLIAFALGLLAKRGWISGADVATLSPSLLVVGVAAWRAVVARKNAVKQVQIANAVPDNVAKVV